MNLVEFWNLVNLNKMKILYHFRKKFRPNEDAFYTPYVEGSGKKGITINADFLEAIERYNGRRLLDYIEAFKELDPLYPQLLQARCLFTQIKLAPEYRYALYTGCLGKACRLKGWEVSSDIVEWFLPRRGHTGEIELPEPLATSVQLFIEQLTLTECVNVLQQAGLHDVLKYCEPLYMDFLGGPHDQQLIDRRHVLSLIPCILPRSRGFNFDTKKLERGPLCFATVCFVDVSNKIFLHCPEVEHFDDDKRYDSLVELMEWVAAW